MAANHRPGHPAPTDGTELEGKKANTRAQTEICDRNHSNFIKYSLGNELPRTAIHFYDSEKKLIKKALDRRWSRLFKSTFYDRTKASLHHLKLSYIT